MTIETSTAKQNLVIVGHRTPSVPANQVAERGSRLRTHYRRDRVAELAAVITRSPAGDQSLLPEPPNWPAALAH